MKKLLIDLEKLLPQRDRLNTIQCEYLFHGRNHGEYSLLEIAEFSIYCRQCKDSHCIRSCPKEALEKQANNLVKRYNLRCVGCRSCVLSCPFGTIFPEVINYVTSKCDYCLNQLSDNPDYIPLCVKTAPPETLQMVERTPETLAKNEYFVGDYLLVKTPNWRAKENVG